MQNYLKQLAAFAAESIRSVAARKAAEKNKPEPLPSPADVNRHYRDRLRRAAVNTATTFPNDLGNYPGKRTPKPAPQPLTARERFERLVLMHVERRGRPHRFLKAA